MELDPLDLRDLMLEAQAEVAAIIRDVQQELVFPHMLNALNMQWMTLPEPLKEKLRKEQPQIYEKIMEVVGNETNPATYQSARPSLGEHGGNNYGTNK